VDEKARQALAFHRLEIEHYGFVWKNSHVTGNVKYTFRSFESIDNIIKLWRSPSNLTVYADF
jgi:hypothetical protein